MISNDKFIINYYILNNAINTNYNGITRNTVTLTIDY